MQRLALLIAATGCATGFSGGAQGIASSRGGRSIEATAAASGGLGDLGGSETLKLKGTLGKAEGGGAEGRIEGLLDVIRFGDQLGWQFQVGSGVSLGAYQSPDWVPQIGGGIHWNLQKTSSDTEVHVLSIALDLIVGYALRTYDRRPEDVIPFTSDGGVFGLALSLRRDVVTNTDLKLQPFD